MGLKCHSRLKLGIVSLKDYLRRRYNLWFTHTLCPDCVTIYLNWSEELRKDPEEVHQIMEVKPATSAKRTVTSFLSPSMALRLVRIFSPEFRLVGGS